MERADIKGKKLEKNFSEGVLVILKKIDFDPLSFIDVPAYLPTYVIDVENNQEEEKVHKKKNKKNKK